MKLPSKGVFLVIDPVGFSQSLEHRFKDKDELTFTEELTVVCPGGPHTSEGIGATSPAASRLAWRVHVKKQRRDRRNSYVNGEQTQRVKQVAKRSSV